MSAVSDCTEPGSSFTQLSCRKRAAAATEGGFTAEIVADVAALCTAMAEGAGAVALVEASFSPADVDTLRDALRAQPPWSDLPMLLVPADVDRDEARQRMRWLVEVLEPVGNVQLAERPLESWVLVRRFTAALRARRRHYATRTGIEQADLER